MIRAARLLALGGVMLVALCEPTGAVEAGDAARGARVFQDKQCGRCHAGAGPGQRGIGPPLAALRRPQGAYEFAGRLWNHAPAMFTVLAHEQVTWPELTASDMADLMAVLLADPARDPTPDAARGHALLVSRGCLKCHALRGEGARHAPDLSERHGALEPAAAWAANLWRHAPRMAQVALARGIVYPRFAGDEMRHLVGYLVGRGRR